MSPDDIEAIADRAATKAVREVLLSMGVALSNDADVVKMQKDFQHLRETREGKDELVKKGKLTLMGIFVASVIAVLLKGFWAYIATGGN
jgi:hypothetical protein